MYYGSYYKVSIQTLQYMYKLKRVLLSQNL